MVTFILLAVGGLNWGLVAISPKYDLVQMLLGTWPMAVTAVYALVGISAVVEIVTHKKNCKCCDSSAGAGAM